MRKKKEVPSEENRAMPESGSSILQVIAYLKLCLLCDAIFVALSIGMVYSSGSHVAILPVLFSAGSILCLWLMLYTMKAAESGDVHRYPYGTGRLENICAIILSLMIAAGTLVIFTQVILALLSGEVKELQMGWAFVLMIVAVVNNSFLGFCGQKLRKRVDNPILASLYHMYHAGAVRDGCFCLVLGLFWILKGGDDLFMSRLDLYSTIILSCYALYHYLPQIWVNFRALADFPLAEEAQLKVMSLLARHFDAYEMPGKIYTTNRGSTHVFEVELAFKPEMSVGELVELEQQMREDFQTVFPNCIFRIIPQALS
jgi:divalent metal cation (Fe/Co/Zn/Cd) transporter